ncbi:MAG: hypothetical protein OHK0013_06540 [Sandaracinaceae bacterium]
MKIVRLTLGSVLGVAAIVGAFSLAPSVAGAQQRPGRGAPRVIQLDEIRIEGRVQKPNAFYILNRSSIGYEVLDLRTSFIREILRSVQHDPF